MRGPGDVSGPRRFVSPLPPKGPPPRTTIHPPTLNDDGVTMSQRVEITRQFATRPEADAAIEEFRAMQAGQAPSCPSWPQIVAPAPGFKRVSYSTAVSLKEPAEVHVSFVDAQVAA